LLTTLFAAVSQPPPYDVHGQAGVDPTCTHAIDQGAICFDSRTVLPVPEAA
jgi:hypothetical protein